MNSDYKGPASEGKRIRDLERQREKQLAELEWKKEQIRSENAISVGDITSKFSGRTSHVDETFKAQTVGLKTREEFAKTREQLEREEELKRIEAEAKPDTKTKKKKRKKKVALQKLSFADDEEAVEEVNDDQSSAGSENEGGDEKRKKKLKIFKNPFVDTSFLPDREREEKEAALKRKFESEWNEEQARLKAEPIEITYSYWDGSGHRASVQVTKGTAISGFLATVQKQWKELRNVSIDNLMYVKEDIIIPHHYTFYDLIVTKARGKSGPLFNFGVYDDVRLLSDVRVETDESHAGKVVERRWYEQNKRLFPASRWVVYEPGVDYGKYTYH